MKLYIRKTTFDNLFKNIGDDCISGMSFTNEIGQYGKLWAKNCMSLDSDYFDGAESNPSMK